MGEPGVPSFTPQMLELPGVGGDRPGGHRAAGGLCAVEPQEPSGDHGGELLPVVGRRWVLRTGRRKEQQVGRGFQVPSMKHSSALTEEPIV